jgi:hypothetical protein
MKPAAKQWPLMAATVGTASSQKGQDINIGVDSAQGFHKRTRKREQTTCERVECVGEEVRVLARVHVVQSCNHHPSMCQHIPSSQKHHHIPLLKNLSWLLLPTITSAPAPTDMSFSFAISLPRRAARQSRSTASSAGMKASRMRDAVMRESCPL